MVGEMDSGAEVLIRAGWSLIQRMAEGTNDIAHHTIRKRGKPSVFAKCLQCSGEAKLVANSAKQDIEKSDQDDSTLVIGKEALEQHKEDGHKASQVVHVRQK